MEIKKPDPFTDPFSKVLTNPFGEQTIYIDGIEKDKIWQLENPDKNEKNKKRIEKIIDNFIFFECKNKNKLITKYYELINNSSSKFWKITYKDAYYKITYGKIGSNGKTIEKNEPLTKILKLIQSKEDKGYKEKKQYKTHKIL